MSVALWTTLRLAGITGLDARAHAVATRMRADPASFVAALGPLVRASVEGEHAAREVMVATALALVRAHGDTNMTTALHAAARAGGDPLIVDLFEEIPSKSLPPLATTREPRVGVAAALDAAFPARTPIERSRELPLPDWRTYGAWRSHGRGKTFALALEHPDAKIVARILDAPPMRLRDVLAIAARRPLDAAINDAVVAHVRWMGHERVREAVASNPFTRATTALHLLPTLRRGVLLGLLDASLSTQVHAFARALVAASSPSR